MNIEELVNRAYTTWVHEKCSWTDHMRAALTELAAGYEEQLAESKRKLEVSGYAWSLMGEELNALRGERVPACRGRNCGATDGISHSQECRDEHDAACGYAVSIPVNTIAYWIDRLDGYGNKFNQQLIAELNTLLAAASQPKKEGE